MTLPFTVLFTLAGEPYTISFQPVHATDATLTNFEAELAKAVPETLRHHLRSTLNMGYALCIRRLMRRAKLLIEGDDDAREASFKAFLNCVFRDATVRLDCCSWGEPARS
jgi:pantothenate kinase type III